MCKYKQYLLFWECKKRFDWQLGGLPHGYDHKYTYSNIGYNLKASDMQAAIGASQIEKIPDFIEHAAYKCYVFVEGGMELRDKIMTQINKKGVPCYSGTCSEVYLEKAFDNTNFRPKQRLANAKALGESSLMFLVHPTLSKQEIKKTCEVLIDVTLNN